MPSIDFSPLHWQCPHCLQSYSKNNQITFLRGTCRHDVCSECITKIVNRRNLIKRASTRKSANRSLIEVSCPIDKCNCGKFLVDNAKFSGEQRNDKAIDLCDEDEQSESNAVERKAGVVKKEAKEEHPEASSNRVVSIKEEYPSEQPVLSRSAAAAATTKTSDRKPLFDVGDNIFAAWWDPKFDVKRQGQASWYPGRVKSYKTVGTDGQYGPTRIYHVKYDDGDELENLVDFWVFPKKDYQLTMRFEEMGWKPIGVRRKFDKTSSDRWARDIGWYEVTIDGQEQTFSRLSDAMEARDASVVRKHGNQTKKSYLNMSEDYPWLFSETAPDSNNGVANTTGINTVASHTETGMSGLGIKNEHGVDLHNEERNDEDRSDAESRFSEVDESKSDQEDERVEWREVKRRRLDLSLEENVQNTEFWSVNREHIEFTKQAFVTKSLFHLNSFVDGKKKKNQAFALFIREGVATPGFNPLPTSIDIDKIAGWTYSQLRDALVRSDSAWGSSQTALWLKHAKVGSFVIMRHEYGKCKFSPRRLKDESGKYIGPVYVIGVITKKVVPWSAEERDIADNRMSEFSNHHWDIHNVCRVSWRRMGYKKTLKEATQSYINHVCQPTLQRICDDNGKVYAGGATSESIRQDLWANATIPIRSDEFPDKFDHIDPRKDE